MFQNFAIPNHGIRQNKACKIHPSMLVDTSGNDVTCIWEVQSLNLDCGTYHPDRGFLWFPSVMPVGDRNKS